MFDDISNAASALRSGGVIAYPTEYCFGLGCDPRDDDSIERLLSIKQRSAQQGVILIASEVEHIARYVDLDSSDLLADILASWPGPNTWVLPALSDVSMYVRGRHKGVAVRVTQNPVCRALCSAFGGAIVSTSANRHGQPALLDATSVEQEMGGELDYIVHQRVGGALAASTIRDGLTGQKIR